MKWIVFHKDTPQSTIDWHVARQKPSFYYTGVPPKFEAVAAEEGWTFPHVVDEVETEGVE